MTEKWIALRDTATATLRGEANSASDVSQLMLDAVPCALVLVNARGRVEAVNRQAGIVFGHPPDRLVGLGLDMLLPERHRARHRDHMAAFAAATMARSMGSGRVLFGLRQDGTEFPVEVGLNPVLIGGERMVIAAVMDISEHIAAQRELTRLGMQLERYHDIVESSDDAVISKDLDGTILIWNSGAERLFGYTAAEAIGARMLHVPEALMEQEHRLLAAIAAGEHFDHLQTQRRHKDGRLVDVSATLSPVCDRDGSVVGVSIIARDITELVRQRRELERSNADLAEFAHIASHDLKSPLRAIDHLAEWIAADLQGIAPPETQESIALLRSRVQRMQGLLAALLSYSRLGREGHRVETVAMADLVTEIVALMNIPPGFTIDCAPDLPTLRTHRTPLHHVLQNLIGNAITHHDRREGRVTIAARRMDDMVELRVTDDGPGIQERFHRKIFQIFQTLVPRDEVESTGVGLAIVKKIVEDHGGSVRVESRPPERGTSFVITWRESPP